MSLQMNMTTSVEVTVGTDGGPVLALPTSHVARWEGALAPTGGRVVDTDYRYDEADAPATDYDAACGAVWGQFGVGSLRFCGVTALALPEPFCALRWHRPGIELEVLASGRWARYEALKQGSPAVPWVDTGIVLELETAGLTFFDPAYAAGRTVNRVDVDVEPGRWRVDQVQARVEGEAVVVVRVRGARADEA